MRLNASPPVLGKGSNFTGSMLSVTKELLVNKILERIKQNETKQNNQTATKCPTLTFKLERFNL